MTDYQPISCVDHERLEYAVLTRRKLDITWRAPHEAERHGRLMPLDVQTKDGAEWLTAGDSQGTPHVIRLDWISVFGEAE